MDIVKMWHCPLCSHTIPYDDKRKKDDSCPACGRTAWTLKNFSGLTFYKNAKDEPWQIQMDR